MLYIQYCTELSPSLASSLSRFHRLTVTNCEMPRQNESTENVGEASGEVTGQSVPSPGNPELVQQIFGLFKDYLSTQVDVKGKQIETKQRIDKETVDLKFKGNQKQFKLKAELDNIFDQIQTANVHAASDKISTLVSEGRKLIHKRQKLIKIADRYNSFSDFGGSTPWISGFDSANIDSHNFRR